MVNGDIYIYIYMMVGSVVEKRKDLEHCLLVVVLSKRNMRKRELVGPIDERN